MIILERQKCGCKIYRGVLGIPVERLCKRHLLPLVKAQAKRDQLLSEVEKGA